MLRFLGLRLLHSVPVIVGITLAAFVLIHAVPGDPIRIMLGGKASQAHIDEVEHQLGIDRPLPRQYVDFVAGIPQGDLGESIILRRPVSSVVGERIGPSVLLLAYATLIAVIVALPLGIASALRRNRVTDHLIRLLTLIAFAMPAFWLGLILIRNLSLNLGAFPVAGYGEGFRRSPSDSSSPPCSCARFAPASSTSSRPSTSRPREHADCRRRGSS
jgi:peptide/nickel transport system permease protein